MAVWLCHSRAWLWLWLWLCAPQLVGPAAGREGRTTEGGRRLAQLVTTSCGPASDRDRPIATCKRPRQQSRRLPAPVSCRRGPVSDKGRSCPRPTGRNAVPPSLQQPCNSPCPVQATTCVFTSTWTPAPFPWPPPHWPWPPPASLQPWPPAASSAARPRRQQGSCQAAVATCCGRASRCRPAVQAIVVTCLPSDPRELPHVLPINLLRAPHQSANLLRAPHE